MRLTRPGLVTLAFLATLVAVRPGATGPATAASFVALPLAAGNVAARRPQLAKDDVVKTLGADEYVYRVYRGDGRAVEMDVAYYRDPRVGRVMHSPLNCLPGNGWQVSDMRTLTVGNGWETRALFAERGKTKLALMYWYQTPRHVTGSEVMSRLHLLGDAFRANRRDSTLVRLVTPIGTNRQHATAALAGVATSLIPQIADRLR